MKKGILAFFLVLSMPLMLFANEVAGGNAQKSGSAEKGFGGEVRMGVSMPILPDFGDAKLNPAVRTLAGLVFTSPTVGGGFQYTVVPHLLAPGFYADIHFNLPTWTAVYMATENHAVLFQIGARVYNQFKFGDFSLNPFFGYNYVYLA